MNSFGEWDHPDDQPTVADSAVEEQPKLYYPALDVFVRDLLSQTYRRDLKSPTRTWCAQWWRHAEATARLEALWRSWEHLRLDPSTGISVWYRDHADHHMNILLDRDNGPFKGCTPDTHAAQLSPLPHTDPPAGMF